jgi:2-polyprenyl-3-methyl-5-hydroxy-6-metoxy-1,4-benzoquinol methylase
MLIHGNSQIFRTLNAIQNKSIREFCADPAIEYEEICCCHLCGGNNFEDITDKDQYGIYCHTVCCITCGLIFSKNQLTESATECFYDKYYRKIYEGVDGPTLLHGYYKKLYEGWVPRVPAFIKKTAFVVEIGCGGGWNLLPFHKVGIKHVGYDFDSSMIAYGHENYGLNLHVGGINDLVSDCRQVDYLIVSQVLEHLKNPLKYLVDLRKIFDRDGLICVTVPSLDFMKYFGGNSTHFDLSLNLQNAHNFTFSERTLGAILVEAGYEPMLILGGYALARANPRHQLINKKYHHASTAQDIVSTVRKIIKYSDAKYKIQSAVPKFFYNSILYRLFYISRPIRTVKFFLINKLGIGI